jgi:hypothetical protein
MPEVLANLPCECGATVAARAADAGGTIACDCGRVVAVPKLSMLRTLAGADAYVTNPVEAIRKAQQGGNDPVGDKCVACGSTDSVSYQCAAVCESSHAKRDGDSNFILRWLFLPVFVNILMWHRQNDEYGDRRGHDVEITFKLPVCRQCESALGNVMRPSIAKQLMARVPLYRDLLTYYPNLSLTIDKPNRTGSS